ncbi:MAG: cysteine--tRNA ligase [Gammaproteobacteria bacterium]|nr:cysteine--tRNA ligase [Gammaproteobacteria bacterium]
MLHIYNTLTRQKQLFKPLEEGKVNMYVCGMTVYDFCHIGHGRIFVIFDMIVRFLRFRGYEVNYVRNITDIDDKIIQRAKENNESIQALTTRTIQAMHEDERALGVLAPTSVPKATEFISEIIAMIETLMENKYAYQASNGDVYFETKKFSSYGEMAQQDLDKLRSGIRVDVVDAKNDPLDFVLWKLAKPGEPEWDSPWGKGRPGWHIECSAMSNNLLGPQFDIHGGGLDLQFPHHQNEIAQSEAANGCQFVNYWMHVGYVTIDKEKMSKSLGNFFTIREVLENYHPEVIRYFMIASHYRSPINYSQQNLTNARNALERLYSSLRNLPEVGEKDDKGFEQQYIAAMEDDFNTPVALAVLFDIAREINRLKDEEKFNEAAQVSALLKRLGGSLGLLQNDPETFLKGSLSGAEVDHIECLIKARETARADKNWAEADRLRNELQLLKVIIEDGPQGTTWRKEALAEHDYS